MLDRFIPLDEATCCDACLGRDNRVAVGGIDFEGAVWEIYRHVAAQVALEVVLLLGRLERVEVSLQSIRRQELLFCDADIGGGDEVSLDDLGDIALADVARGVVRCPVFGNRRPVECLPQVLAGLFLCALRAKYRPRTYMVDQGIGQDVIVA